MNGSSDARRAILGSIRRHLAESAPHDVVHSERHQPPVPSHGLPLPVLNSSGVGARTRTAADPPDPLSLFRLRLEAVGGTLTETHGAAEAVAALESILTAAGARQVAASDAPRVRPLVESACAAVGAELLLDAPFSELFGADVGVSTAQWGIAETGSLVLESARERHRFVSLIPRVHVALLRADHLCETLGEALANVREGDAEGTTRNAAVTLITGPSRTSDIELTLAIGVHGPQELHVILMEQADSLSDASATAGAETPDPA
jgi:L-lactate utilization protein LutC